MLLSGALYSIYFLFIHFQMNYQNTFNKYSICIHRTISFVCSTVLMSESGNCEWKSIERGVWIRKAESSLSLLHLGRAEFSLVSQRWHTVPIQCSQRRPSGKLPYLVLWFCKWRTLSGLVRVWDLTVWRGNYTHERSQWRRFLFH